MIRRLMAHTARSRKIFAVATVRLLAIWFTLDNIALATGIILITRGVALRWSGAMALIVCGTLILGLTILRALTDGER